MWSDVSGDLQLRVYRRLPPHDRASLLSIAPALWPLMTVATIVGLPGAAPSQLHFPGLLWVAMALDVWEMEKFFRFTDFALDGRRAVVRVVAHVAIEPATTLAITGVDTAFLVEPSTHKAQVWPSLVRKLIGLRTLDLCSKMGGAVDLLQHPTVTSIRVNGLRIKRVLAPRCRFLYLNHPLPLPRDLPLSLTQLCLTYAGLEIDLAVLPDNLISLSLTSTERLGSVRMSNMPRLRDLQVTRMTVTFLQPRRPFAEASLLTSVALFSAQLSTSEPADFRDWLALGRILQVTCDRTEHGLIVGWSMLGAQFEADVTFLGKERYFRMFLDSF